MTPLLTSALATCSRSAGSGASPKRADHLVIDRDRLLRAAQLPERDALVDQRLGDLLAQRRARRRRRSAPTTSS